MAKAYQYEPRYDITIPERPEGNPNDPKDYDEQRAAIELTKCRNEKWGAFYFIHNYCQIHDPKTGKWIPFKLWPAQIDVLKELVDNRYIVVPKSRQMGISWLCIAFILWLALFRPSILGLFFSVREDEAKDLLDSRLKGMYSRLPHWMKSREVKKSNTTEWAIANGSRIKASSTGGSDSYAATAVLVDEAELVHEGKKSLSELIRDVSPTIDSSNGWLILISRSKRERPDSTFKRIIQASIRGESEFVYSFIPWYARPDRDEEWYERKRQEAVNRDGHDEGHKEQYPTTIEEFLSPPAVGMRFPAQWIARCYTPMESTGLIDWISNYEELQVKQQKTEQEEVFLAEKEHVFDQLSQIPLTYLDVYRFPQGGDYYAACIDGAEGGQGADPSVCTIFDWHTGEEMAVLAGRIETEAFAGYVKHLAIMYNNAKLVPERNNIGKALIMWWQTNSSLSIIEGSDSTSRRRKYGWHQNKAHKAIMWSKLATYLRDELISLHSLDTTLELRKIDAETLRAAGNGHDDRAITCGLYAVAKELLHKELQVGFIDVSKI